MFSGIVREIGTVERLISRGDHDLIAVRAREISRDLQIDDSVAVNGICLTVIALNGDVFTVQAVKESLERTTIPQWRAGQKVNCERALAVSDRLDGHIVQGHVDGTAVCIRREDYGAHREYFFKCEEKLCRYMVEKGSIAVDGVSLTLTELTRDTFALAVIPYTLEHSILGDLKTGQAVNVETDVLGKYYYKYITGENAGSLKDRLRHWGYGNKE